MTQSADQSAALTPMLRQHAAVKAKYPDHIVFFRMGDFYEMFGEDAIRGAQILGITLTRRPHGKDGEIPLAGVPHHQAERYLARLVEAGQRVVVCEQMEDPKQAKGLVQRDVVEIITPGTVLNPGALDETQTPALAALSGPDGDGQFALAWAEATNGRFAVDRFGPEAMAEWLASQTPSEIIVADDADARLGQLVDGRAAVTRWPAWRFEFAEAERALKAHFHVHDLEGVAPPETASDRMAIAAAGALLSYLKETKRAPLAHIARLTALRTRDTITLDPRSALHLDVIGRPHSDRPNLAGVLDHCHTAMGRRLLRERLTHPLVDKDGIERRLDEIQALVADRGLLANLRETLRGIFDVERFVGRLGAERIGPRDLIGLREALGRWPRLTELTGRTPLSSPDDPDAATLAVIHTRLAAALVDDPPLGVKEGGIFRRGYSPELDALYSGAADARAWIAGLQARLRAETGIGSLKVGYNKVFNYYIEVSRTQTVNVPADWIRKQTLVNGERYIMAELKEKEEIVLRADERAAQIEEQLFITLRDELAGQIGALAQLASALARLDVAGSLAQAALARGYSRPRLTEDRALEIRGGRHPVLETINPAGGFVPNDTIFSDEQGWLQLLTGPNMAGKSTYLRQVGLIVLMAQAGSFVPADVATIGICDRIFTRVGADDDLARNRSTFMVEMAETARILQGATPRSLVLFDEVGRGTSTYDGVAIAWALAEHLAADPARCPRTLFATHYHELTALADRFDAIRNHHLAVKEKEGRVVFLFRVKEGACDDSFGIHVAKMAGVPPTVVTRAAEIVRALEDGTFDPLKGRGTLKPRPRVPVQQGSLFSETQAQAVDELTHLRTDSMTPIEALNKLDELTRRLRGD
jgi:DNA mismatch repair protein MutS